MAKIKDMKKYQQDHYINNKWIYLHKARIQRGSIKDFDFDTCYDYYLWKNRGFKQSTLKKKNYKNATTLASSR
jgi:hypothetical protein